MLPEVAEVFLVPDFDVGEAVAVVGDDGLDEGPPLIKMLPDGLGPLGNVKEDGEWREALRLGIGDDLVVVREVERSAGLLLHPPPLHVESYAADAGRGYPTALLRALVGILHAVQVRADAVGAVGCGGGSRRNQNAECRMQNAE